MSPREGVPVSLYLVAGVERGEEHEGTGAGHVERSIPRVQQLRPQEPAGAHGTSGGCWSHQSQQPPASPQHAPSEAAALNDTQGLVWVH